MFYVAQTPKATPVIEAGHWLAWRHAWEPPGQTQAWPLLCMIWVGWAPLGQPQASAVCGFFAPQGVGTVQTMVPELAFASCYFLFAVKLKLLSSPLIKQSFPGYTFIYIYVLQI